MYDSHWHPDVPQQGSAYRCLQSTRSKPDPRIKAVFREVLGGSAADVAADLNLLPGGGDFSLWIDPGVVSIRVGERGAVTTLYNAMQLQTRRQHPHQRMAAPAPAPAAAQPSPHDHPFSQFIQQPQHFHSNQQHHRPRSPSPARKTVHGRSVSPNLSPNARTFSPGGGMKLGAVPNPHRRGVAGATSAAASASGGVASALRF